MISIQNISHSFDEKQVLKNINLDLTEDKIAIIGANGSGKSTLARMLNGLIIPQCGNVVVDGLSTKKNLKQIREKVGFVFQDPDMQIVFPIVEDDLAFGLKNMKLDRETIENRINEVLVRHNISHLKYAPIHQLSGGEKQIIAISGVLVMNPEYMIFDEPTTLLDLRNKKIITDLIKNLSQKVIVISHDLDFIKNFDRVIVIDNGEVYCDDVPDVAISKYKKLMLC